MARRNALLLGALLAAGCGGGSSGTTAPPPLTPPATTPSTFTPGEFEASNIFAQMCEVPRTGTDPATGQPWPDMQATTLDENNWLRSWSNELYLWYDEITDIDPGNYTTPAYFDLQKTFATTPSGSLKDKFHFTIPTDEWRALSQSGVSAGYGASFTVISPSVPREVVVAFTEPGTPAIDVGLARGATILEIDGVDVVNGTAPSDVDALNNGLFPSASGESHEFLVLDIGASDPRLVTMVSQEITSDPVQLESTTFDTGSGLVGYMLFNRHIATAELELVNAVESFATLGITDLIVDMRYNGGGFLDIANEFAYMIAGPSAAQGQVFEEIQFNDQHQTINPVTGATLTPTLFHTTGGRFTAPNEDLPVLNLSRVFMLTGPGTCSASESVINGLRGIGIEVIQIGSTTCGKPYGFYAFDNCGTTYFSIQFKGVNAEDFGDYTDGFTPENASAAGGTRLPGCSVADDFGRALGDASESRVAAALQYRIDGSCPAPTGSADTNLAITNPASFVGAARVPLRAALESRILQR